MVLSFSNVFENDKDLEIFFNDLPLFDPVSGSYCYPDLLIVQGKPHFVDEQCDTLLSPAFIAEILSPFTPSRDLSEKFDIYKSIPSIKEYRIVAQLRPHIILYKKIAVNHCRLFEFGKLTDLVGIIDNKFQLSLSSIYKKVF